MVYFLIDNSYILTTIKYNNRFFWNKGLIPININYKLNKIPYYENSRYYYRNTEKLIDKKIIDKKTVDKKLKPVQNSSRLSDLYYNSKKSRGKIIKFEYIPIKSQKYNITPERTYIRSVEIWTNSPYLDTFNKTLFLYTNFLKKGVKIKFILEDYKYSLYGTRYKWIPYKEYNITNSIQYLDISDFINNSFTIEENECNFTINIILEYY